MIPWGVGALALLIIVQQSQRALLVLLTDGVIAAGIVVAAALAGLWGVALLRCRDLPMRWHLLLGAGLGVGGLSLLTLALGFLGRLDRALWISLLAAGGLAGMVRLAMIARLSRSETAPTAAGGVSRADAPHAPSQISDLKSQGSHLRSDPSKLETRNLKLATLWLLAAPFAAMALLVATVPPGLLWAEEGNGYDALEYHLQMPREFLEAGRIDYAPHNVYANFPSNAEMLYLVAMIVAGDPVDGAMVGQIINALLAFLAVAAAWLAGREFSPAAGRISGVLAATCGWLVYLSGIAYVENAMLFFGMMSAAAIVRAIGSVSRPNREPTFGEGGPPVRAPGGMGPRSGPVANGGMRWRALAGLMAGFAAGCKYTAVVLVVVPLGLVILTARWKAHRHRAAAFAWFCLGAFGSFAPWAVKNAAFTGNPVFPLAHSVFRSYPQGWSADDAAHFAVCHAPAPDESTIAFRLKTLWEKVLADPGQRFGPAVFLLALGGAVVSIRARGSPGGPWTVALLAQLVLWAALTHLYARFAVVLLIPLVLLGAVFMNSAGAMARRVGVVLLVAGAAWNLGWIARVYHAHLYAGGQRIGIEGAVSVFTDGLVPGYEHLQIINRALPEDAKLLFVGEARAFYVQRDVDYRVVFNRDPFVELLKTSPAPDQVRNWLIERGFTHVFAAWSEIRRLSRSRYGFHGLDEVKVREWIEALAAAGVLTRTHTFNPAARLPQSELFEVVTAE